MNSKKSVIRTHHKPRKYLTNNPNINLTNGIALWASFYRENPHRFVIDYLGINIHVFQMILIYAMDKVDNFVWIASRGLRQIIFDSCILLL